MSEPYRDPNPTGPLLPYCVKHQEMEERVKHLEAVARDMAEEQRTFISQMRSWSSGLDAKFDRFATDTDIELRGDHGPDGKPGIKQTLRETVSRVGGHDDKLRNMAALIDGGKDKFMDRVMSVLVSVTATVVAAIVLYLIFTKMR